MTYIEIILIAILAYIILFFLLIPVGYIYSVWPCWIKGKYKKENVSCEIKSKHLFLPRVETRSRSAQLLELEEKIEISKEKVKIGIVFTIAATIVGMTIIFFTQSQTAILLIVPALFYIFDEFILDEYNKRIEYTCYLKRFGNIKGYRLNQMRLFHPYDNIQKKCQK